MSKTTSSDECVNLRHIRCQLCAVTVKDEKNLQARVQNKFFLSYYHKVADTFLTFGFCNCFNLIVIFGAIFAYFWGRQIILAEKLICFVV
jgi:hypothetical protein